MRTIQRLRASERAEKQAKLDPLDSSHGLAQNRVVKFTQQTLVFPTLVCAVLLAGPFESCVPSRRGPLLQAPCSRPLRGRRVSAGTLLCVLPSSSLRTVAASVAVQSLALLCAQNACCSLDERADTEAPELVSSLCDRAVPTLRWLVCKAAVPSSSQQELPSH